jgi:hypothetical protein
MQARKTGAVPTTTPCRARRPYPTQPPAHRAAHRRAGNRVTPATAAIPTSTGSSADEVGAEFTVQQVHQSLPVLGGRFGWPQVRLRLPDRTDGDSSGGHCVVVDDPPHSPAGTRRVRCGAGRLGCGPAPGSRTARPTAAGWCRIRASSGRRPVPPAATPRWFQTPRTPQCGTARSP